MMHCESALQQKKRVAIMGTMEGGWQHLLMKATLLCSVKSEKKGGVGLGGVGFSI